MSAWDEGIARALWNEGKSAQQIALYFGMTRNAVCGRLWRAGMKREGAAMWGTRKPAAPKPQRVKKFSVAKIARPPRVEAAPAVAVVVDIMAPRPFMSRTRRECSWILDDGQACCNQSDVGASYCAGHRALVYRPTVTSRDYERSLRRYVA